MYYKIFAALGLSALLLSVGVTAQAAPVPVDLDFVGPGPNNLNLSASADGTITTGLVGKFILPFTGTPNPQTDPIGLNPDTITVTTSPAREPLNETGGPETAVINFDGSNLWTPLDISDVNLDLLNGAPLTAALDQIVLETNSIFPDPTIKIDLAADFQSVKFFQGANNVVFGPGGTYAIPGTLVGVVDLNVGLDAFGGGLAISTGLGTQEFATPFTLEGTLSANNTTSTDADLSFDGIVSGSFLLTGISTTITFDSFGAQASISLDVAGGINLNFDYHLEDTAHVPEPGTFVLLGIGAVGLVPFVRRRLRKS